MKKIETPKTEKFKAPTIEDIAVRIVALRENSDEPAKNGERRGSDVLRCNLNDGEKLSYGGDLASTTNELESLEADKAQIVAEFTAKIKAKEAAMSSLANKIRMGYEMRSVPTITFYDVPKVGFKTTYRIDTGDPCDTRTMDAVEKQHLLDFEEACVAAESGNGKLNVGPKKPAAEEPEAQSDTGL